MGNRVDDLDLSDGPLLPRDLYAIARHYAAEMKAAGQGDKTVMALYRVPAYLRWSVESLSEEATGGALEPAATAALDIGLATIRTFPGVHEICAARLSVLACGDAEVMSWFNSFPAVSALAENTDDTGGWRLHVSRTVAKTFAKLARSLGMSISRLATYALMAGVLHGPSLSAARYRKAMLDTLQRLKGELRRRGHEATAKSASATPRDPSTEHLWTAADLLEPTEDDHDNEE